MKYSLDKQENYTLLRLDEEKLDNSLAPQLKSDLITLGAEGHTRMIMDLSSVKYIDSSGLSALLIGHRMCQENGGSFVIAGAGDHTRKLVEISQLHNVLNMQKTVDEAVDALFLDGLERDLGAEDQD